MISYESMLKKSRIFPVIVSATVAASMFSVMAPIAVAESSYKLDDSAVTSTRSFPKVTSVRRDILTESTSTDVDPNSSWGSIETLNVPQTKSPKEIAAEQARRAVAHAAAGVGADAPASRSGVRGVVQQAPMPVVVPPDGKSVAALLNFATQFLGKVPYRSGGNTPAGWDCSGFVQYVFANIGVALPRTSGAQATVGTPVPSLAQAQPGDIIANGQHASIYVGNGMVINSQLAGTKYDPIRYVFPGSYAIRRIL